MRFDLRPFLYNARWTWQFDKIDRELEEINKKRAHTQQAARSGDKRKREDEDNELKLELRDLMNRVGEITDILQRKKQKSDTK